MHGLAGARMQDAVQSYAAEVPHLVAVESLAAAPAADQERKGYTALPSRRLLEQDSSRIVYALEIEAADLRQLSSRLYQKVDRMVGLEKLVILVQED